MFKKSKKLLYLIPAIVAIGFIIELWWFFGQDILPLGKPKVPNITNESLKTQPKVTPLPILLTPTIAKFSGKVKEVKVDQAGTTMLVLEDSKKFTYSFSFTKQILPKVQVSIPGSSNATLENLKVGDSVQIEQTIFQGKPYPDTIGKYLIRKI